MSLSDLAPKIKPQKHIAIFTDGACRGNPGPGGWAALLRYNKHNKAISGAENNTTNNRMELTAVINALKILKEPCVIDLTTDSEYVKNGVTKWLPGWKARNWRKGTTREVKNIDLWQQLDELVHKHSLKWHWVRGHSGHHENEIVDELARTAIDKLLKSS